MNRILTVALAGSILFMSAGCKSKQVVQKPVEPDYSRPLPPGQSALRLITDPARMPDIAGAYAKRDVFLEQAIGYSKKWFDAPSSKTYFPFEKITHEQAKASLYAFEEIMMSSPDAASFVAEVKKQFDVYESVGYNGEGIVLFTGYYAPIFNASKTQSAKFNTPLYKRPLDLATDPKTGEPMGRKLPDGSTAPYPTRAEIESSGMLKGSELVWVEDALSAYIIQVNGSAKLRLEDGSEMFIGYAGKTDRPYVGLGRSMVDAGLISANELSLPSIRKKFRENPEAVKPLMNKNESYVFFTEYPRDKWPSGSLGVKVTAECSLATDKKIYPRGGLLIVDTQSVNFSMGKSHFLRFMLDQDTGGAIRAPGRADIYMGEGTSAEILAGGQYAEGRLYYFFLKQEYVTGSAQASAKPVKG